MLYLIKSGSNLKIGFTFDLDYPNIKYIIRILDY